MKIHSVLSLNLNSLKIEIWWSEQKNTKEYLYIKEFNQLANMKEPTGEYNEYKKTRKKNMQSNIKKIQLNEII